MSILEKQKTILDISFQSIFRLSIELRLGDLVGGMCPNSEPPNQEASPDSGLAGRGSEALSWPRLAGLQVKYFVK